MIVVSDLGGTLTLGSPIRALAAWVRQHQSGWRGRVYFFSIFPNYLLAKRGWKDWTRFTEESMESSLKILRDMDEDTWQVVVAYMIETQMWPLRREDMVERLQGHVAEGAKVYIASGGWESMVDQFAQRIGAEGVGTETGIVNGRVQMMEPCVHGNLKTQKILDRIGGDTIDIAYGDTYSDLPLLEKASHPVAVYPDERLRQVAEERGWEIFGSGNAWKD